MTNIHPKNASLLGSIANPNYLPHPWTQPTHHPKRHPDPISRFCTSHWTDRQTVRQTDGLTDGAGNNYTCTSISLRSINDSDAANNYNYF